LYLHVIDAPVIVLSVEEIAALQGNLCKPLLHKCLFTADFCELPHIDQVMGREPVHVRNLSPDILLRSYVGETPHDPL
jgi:hypothetical protein